MPENLVQITVRSVVQSDDLEVPVAPQISQQENNGMVTTAWASPNVETVPF